MVKKVEESEVRTSSRLKDMGVVRPSAVKKVEKKVAVKKAAKEVEVQEEQEEEEAAEEEEEKEVKVGKVGWKVGAMITPIVLVDQNGEKIDLVEQTKEHGIVVFFYPKANTPGCSNLQYLTTSRPSQTLSGQF